MNAHQTSGGTRGDRAMSKRLIGSEVAGLSRWVPLVGRAMVIDGGHTVTGGKTGSGKSWLATHLAIEAARSGSGVVVLDPHAALLENIIQAGAHVLADTGTVILWPGGPLSWVHPW